MAMERTNALRSQNTDYKTGTVQALLLGPLSLQSLNIELNIHVSFLDHNRVGIIYVSCLKELFLIMYDS